MAKKIGWCLVGASDIAANVVGPAINAQPDAEVVKVVSGDIERARATASRLTGTGTTSLDEALADPNVDAIYVSSVNRNHYAQTMAAIAAGKHVLCEKPLAMTKDEAKEMVQAAAAAGLQLGTNHHMRNSVPHTIMRDRIAAGDIGEPVAVSVHHVVELPEIAKRWRTTDPGSGAGVALDITVHDVDCARFVLGTDPSLVIAQQSAGRMTRSSIDETVSSTAVFGGNVLGSFLESFVSGHAPTRLEVFGTEGAFIGEGIQSMQPIGTLSHLVLKEAKQVDLGEREDLYVIGIRRFQAAMHGDGAPPATGEDGQWSLAYALALLDSAATGHAVPVTIS